MDISAKQLRSNVTTFLMGVICLVISLFSIFVMAEPVTITVKDQQGVGIAGIAVYLEWLDGKLPVSSSFSAIDITQKDKGFSPYVSVVQTGTKVTFSNLDDITHHIYSISGTNRFSYTIRAGEKTPNMASIKPGLIAMGCNIHDWMSGYLLVLDTPYFNLTDNSGRAVIDIAHRGTFRVIAWHPQMKENLVQEVHLPDKEEITLQLTQLMMKIPSQKSVDDFDFLDGY